MSIRGLEEVEARIAAAIRDIENASHDAVREVSFDLLGKAVDLAPVDTGDLRGSGKVEFEEDRNKLVGIVSFNTPYARRQHEELTWRHPEGGQAKYLQQPFEENADRYIQKIRDSVRRET